MPLPTETTRRIRNLARKLQATLERLAAALRPAPQPVLIPIPVPSRRHPQARRQPR